VINVDEEEAQPSTVAEQAAELPEGLQEDICYPTRDDPHFVQVCLKDLECLAPREYLTSPVMNFYMRYFLE
jgi:ubiquitin-like-specific protease 1C/D